MIKSYIEQRDYSTKLHHEVNIAVQMQKAGESPAF